MAIEKADYPARRHPSLDGLAAFAWEKPDVANTVLTNIANGGLITPDEVQFSRLTSVEQARQLDKLKNQNLGILGTSVLGIRSYDSQARGMPIIFLVETGMPDEFQEVLKRAAPGVKIFVWELSMNDPMITGKW